MIQQCLLIDEVVKRAEITQNYSYFLHFGRDILVKLSEKSSIANHFEQELVRSCNLPISKRKAKAAPA